MVLMFENEIAGGQNKMKVYVKTSVCMKKVVYEMGLSLSEICNMPFLFSSTSLNAYHLYCQ